MTIKAKLELSCVLHKGPSAPGSKDSGLMKQALAAFSPREGRNKKPQYQDG